MKRKRKPNLWAQKRTGRKGGTYLTEYGRERHWLKMSPMAWRARQNRMFKMLGY